MSRRATHEPSAVNPNRQKTAAGITVYLLEELGDARLRCAQIKRCVKQALDLIDKSSHRDHFFEVAGHLIEQVPDLVLRMEKATDAAALAAPRLDYEEIKDSLKPEKITELESVMDEVRLRYLQRRSETNTMRPKTAASQIREILQRIDAGEAASVESLLSVLAGLQPVEKRASAGVSTEVRAALADAVAYLECPTPSRETAYQKVKAIVAMWVGAHPTKSASRSVVASGEVRQIKRQIDVVLREIASSSASDPSEWEGTLTALRDALAEPTASLRSSVTALLRAQDQLDWALHDLAKGALAKGDLYKELKGISDSLGSMKVKLGGAGEEFQKVNPEISDEDVEKINNMHQKYKDQIKDQ